MVFCHGRDTKAGRCHQKHDEATEGIQRDKAVGVLGHGRHGKGANVTANLTSFSLGGWKKRWRAEDAGVRFTVHAYD